MSLATTLNPQAATSSALLFSATGINSNCCKRKLVETQSLTRALLMVAPSNKKRCATTALTVSVSTVTTSAPPPAVMTNNAPESPADFVARVFRARGLDPESVSLPFVTPTEAMIAAYRSETLKAARTGDVSELRLMLQKGQSLNCCNRFGESLIHLACRRGNLELVRFLVLEAKVTLLIRDDYHRTVLHDSFWTPEPNLDLVDFLLDHVPELLCVRDVRGHAPVDYIRQEHKMIWLDFLRQREHKLGPKLHTVVESQSPKLTVITRDAIHENESSPQS